MAVILSLSFQKDVDQKKWILHKGVFSQEKALVKCVVVGGGCVVVVVVCHSGDLGAWAKSTKLSKCYACAEFERSSQANLGEKWFSMDNFNLFPSRQKTLMWQIVQVRNQFSYGGHYHKRVCSAQVSKFCGQKLFKHAYLTFFQLNSTINCLQKL